MELKKIQYFLRIIDKGSLSKAAESLYLSQPTLSRFLARLEESAGVRLFHRRHDSSLELTEAGKVYLEAARKIENIWQDMENQLGAMQQRESHVIRLGGDTDLIHTHIQAAAEKLAEQFPQVTVQFQPLLSDEIQQAVLDGAIDIGLSSYAEFQDGLAYTNIRQCEVDLVVSKSHPLAKYSYQQPGMESERIRLSELPSNTPFFLMRKGRVLRERIDAYLQAHQFVPYVPSTYARHDMLADMLQTSDELVGFCPRRNQFPALAYIALDPPFFHKRGICYRKGKILTAAEKALISLLNHL